MKIMTVDGRTYNLVGQRMVHHLGVQFSVHIVSYVHVMYMHNAHSDCRVADALLRCKVHHSVFPYSSVYGIWSNAPYTHDEKNR